MTAVTNVHGPSIEVVFFSMTSGMGVGERERETIGKSVLLFCQIMLHVGHGIARKRRRGRRSKRRSRQGKCVFQTMDDLCVALKYKS